MRPGPNARGDAAHDQQKVAETLPATRKSPLRGAINFSHACDQVGVPASVHDEASLGFSCVAYQSPYFALELWDGGIFRFDCLARRLADRGLRATS